MKTKTIEARQIGWMVEFRFDVLDRWYDDRFHVRPTKEDAINQFGRNDYTKKQSCGLARCVPVYVEVKP